MTCCGETQGSVSAPAVGWAGVQGRGAATTLQGKETRTEAIAILGFTPIVNLVMIYLPDKLISPLPNIQKFSGWLSGTQLRN